MELKQLVYFLAVAKHLNFSRAAEELYVSQPVLSYQIAELERELGTKLFVRSRRAITLTLSGERLLEPARRTLEGAEEIRELSRRRLTPNGWFDRLDIAFEDTEDHFEYIGISQKVGAFIQRNAELDYSLWQKTHDECIELLMREELDAAFLILRHNESLPPELDSRILCRDQLCVVVLDRMGELPLQEVFNHYELALVERKPRGRTRILGYLKKMGIDPVLHEVDSMPAAFAYLYAGRTALVCPRHMVGTAPERGLRLIEMPGEAMNLYYAAVWNRQRKNPVLPLFLEDISRPAGS